MTCLGSRKQGDEPFVNPEAGVSPKDAEKQAQRKI
jgi:hypothetical protein